MRGSLVSAAFLKGRIIAVLNLGSGSCDASSPGRIKKVFDDAGLDHAEVFSVEPGKVNRALSFAARRGDVVVVLGGDGTIRAAAERCGRAGKLLIPLPGGTMNVLPRALFGNKGWEQALADTLAEPEVRVVSGGSADGKPFFCSAIVGAPSLWAETREAVRRGDLGQVASTAATAIRRQAETVDYDFGGGVCGSARAVAVTCPLVVADLDDDAPVLDAAALDEATAAGLFRLAFNAIFNDWRDDPAVSRARVKSVHLSARGRVPVILDGETMPLGRSVNIRFVPRAFRALTPAEKS